MYYVNAPGRTSALVGNGTWRYLWSVEEDNVAQTLVGPEGLRYVNARGYDVMRALVLTGVESVWDARLQQLYAVIETVRRQVVETLGGVARIITKLGA